MVAANHIPDVAAPCKKGKWRFKEEQREKREWGFWGGDLGKSDNEGQN